MSNPSKNAVDPSIITVVVVSTAEIAKAKVIPALQSVSSTVLIGVSSRNKERAQSFVDENIVAKNNRDTIHCRGMSHDEIFSSASIDALYVPLPSRVRNNFIRKALQEGKHIYSEKPHGGSVLELKSILDLAKERNLQWMDGTMWYHSYRTKAMEEELFVRGVIGKIRRVSASFSWGGGGLVDRDWVEGGNGRTDPSRESMGMLGDSGHYPISAVAWAFQWELPTKVCATYTKRNKLGAIIECEAFLWFKDGRRAIIDTSCELPHRSQFEVVGEKGVLKVDDLVGGQGRSGNFGAYEGPFLGSSSFVLGDYLGKDHKEKTQPCDHVQCLVEEFSQSVRNIRDKGGIANLEWSKRSLCTHTIMCSIFESAMRGGVDVQLISSSDGATKFIIGEETFHDVPTKDWNQK